MILTGMGHDGAAGLLKMRRAGARTRGQDEASCLIYGMPKAAKLLGAVEAERPLSKLAAEVLSLSQNSGEAGLPAANTHNQNSVTHGRVPESGLTG